jgi:hypothetical protein
MMLARKRLPQVSHGASVPAPIGGLNAKDALANMPETDAVILDNWFPQPSWVEVRRGTTSLATFTGICESVMAYNGTSSSKLFAAVNNSGTRSIYDITAGGAVSVAAVGGVGNTVQAVTNTQYDWVQIGTTGATDYLILANGSDPMLVFDGSTWTVSGITGVTTSTISCVAIYHQRLWMVQKNSLRVWYLAIGAFNGAATSLDLGSLFKLGGYIQTIITISIDNASGANDYIAFVSSMGEVIVYQGTDPSSVSTWFLSAHFRVGRPQGVGRRAWTKVGSDAILICADGFIKLSEALLTDRSQTVNAVSDKIRKAVTDDILAYAGNFGWQVVLYPIGNKILINVPKSSGPLSYQYVMNTLTGAWCTFGKLNSSWNANCFEISGDNLYFGGSGAVYQCDTGTADNGSGIIATAKQAFNYFGNRGQLKHWKFVRPNLTVTGNIALSLTLNVDFDPTLPTNAIPISSGNSAVWNVSLWSTPTYWGDATKVTKPWVSLGGIGYCAAVTARFSGSGVSVQWASTDYMFEPGGLLG